MPVSGPVLGAVVVIALVMWGGVAIGHGVKKLAKKSPHAVMHVVTLGKK